MAKLVKLEVYVIDHNDEYSDDDIQRIIENDVDYINPKVLELRSVDIGEWHDDHELNYSTTTIENFRKYFPKELPITKHINIAVFAKDRDDFEKITSTLARGKKTTRVHRDHRWVEYNGICYKYCFINNVCSGKGCTFEDFVFGKDAYLNKNYTSQIFETLAPIVCCIKDERFTTTYSAFMNLCLEYNKNGF